MLIHNVYFWLKADVSENDLKDFEKGLETLVNAVPQIVKGEYGKAAVTEDREVVDNTFGYSLFLWFENLEDHNTYQVHEAHDKFISDHSSLWSKVRVRDSYSL